MKVFANAATFRRKVLDLVKAQRCRTVLLQFEAVTDVDVTAAAVLQQLLTDLDRVEVAVVFVEVRQRIIGQLEHYGIDLEAQGKVQRSIKVALAALDEQ